MKNILILSLSLCAIVVKGQVNNVNTNKFRQLKQELATPNVYRNAAGAPGHEYYQQKADYVIDIELDDEKQVITGTQTITYKNNSPDALEYLWLQLDQNMRASNSNTGLIQTNGIGASMSFQQLARMHNKFDGGFKIEYVRDKSGNDLSTTVNQTMMRVNLTKPLASGKSFILQMKWWYNVNNRDEIGGRSGYEYFPKDDNYLYTIAQFYPRMAVYNEVEGWQNKQFLGRGEFALPFGDFKVNITVPADHIVAATGSLTNRSKVLNAEQLKKWELAKKEFVQPVIIVSQEEVEKKEKIRSKEKKTWSFKAVNVRDFGFACSRKLIWDAMNVTVGGKSTMAMSYYPKEGNPLWERYSTKVVAHTIKTYSKFTVDYPYPVAISVHSKSIGMEYPMICFNGGRPNEDGTYSKRTKYAMIGVIIHEVGHNFFPMIINSDERQWTWMDEGLNTFVQYLTESEWERDYPARRGPAYKIVDYMKGNKDNISPIMTNSESIKQFGNNAYGKPATALNILRETVMGRDLFDYSFKMYCERWKFKHPTPADFFRTMEDASGVDLDWFWRGWFYTTDHCDQAIVDIDWFKIDTKNPAIEKAMAKELKDNKRQFIGDVRNRTDLPSVYEERDSSLKDFYDSYDPFKVTLLDQNKYDKYVGGLDESQLKLLDSKFNYYTIRIQNKGVLVMPVILKFSFTDGTSEEVRIPAEIWKSNDMEVAKTFFFEKELSQVELDPWLEIADTDRGDNQWPPKVNLSKFKLYEQKVNRWGVDPKRENPMQKQKRINKLQKK
jgi:hypothetical protein